MHVSILQKTPEIYFIQIAKATTKIYIFRHLGLTNYQCHVTRGCPFLDGLSHCVNVIYLDQTETVLFFTLMHALVQHMYLYNTASLGALKGAFWSTDTTIKFKRRQMFKSRKLIESLKTLGIICKVTPRSHTFWEMSKSTRD